MACQPHQVKNLTKTTRYNIVKTEDTEEIGRQRAKLSKIKAEASQVTCRNCLYHCAPL